MNAIEVYNLSVEYGSVKAVDNFSFTIPAGRIQTLVGPDGAGKTSIFRSISNLIEYTDGEVSILGFDLQKEFDRIKPLLGYMPQNFSLYPDLSVEENLFFYARMYGLSKNQAHITSEKLYQFSGLGDFKNRRAGALSGGMKQKLALSCNLIHDPKILILDEPTTGVDPLSRRQFWDILKALRDDGCTIFVSTPYMDEVELSDFAIFIHEGQKLAEGTPEQLANLFEGNVFQLSITATTQLMNALNNIRGLRPRRFGSSIHLYLDKDKNIESFRTELSQMQLSLDQFKPIKPELEDSFIQLMGE